MDAPVIYVIRDLTPFATASMGLAGVVVGWLVARRRGRIDKLREVWATWTASAFEAVERCSSRLVAEESARSALRAIESKHGTDVARRAEPEFDAGLDGPRTIASDAIRRLRRDYHLLQILEDSDDALKPPASIVNALLDETADKYRYNVLRALINHIAFDNRMRFLRPWRRWRRWRRPQPLADLDLDAFDREPKAVDESSA